MKLVALPSFLAVVLLLVRADEVILDSDGGPDCTAAHVSNSMVQVKQFVHERLDWVKPEERNNTQASHSPTWSRDSKLFPRFEVKTLTDGIVSNIVQEADEQELYFRLVRPADTVLSLGANIGTGCILVDRILSDPSKQYCVEPNPQLWPILHLNRARTNSTFQVVKGVITDATKDMFLNVYDNDPKMLGSAVHMTSAGEHESNHAVKIQTHKLDDLRGPLHTDARPHFDVLLADCEGCMCSFIEEYPMLLHEIRALVFEADGGSHSQCYRDLEQQLRGIGFTFQGCPGTMFRAWERRSGGVKTTSNLVFEDTEAGSPNAVCGMGLEESDLFFATLNNSFSAVDAPHSYWASYLPQSIPRPRPLEEGGVVAHTYFLGNYTSRPALSVKSFLATQNRHKTHVVVWLDVSTPGITKELKMLQGNGVEVRLFDFEVEAVGTPLEGFNYLERYHGHESWPMTATASDLVRYVVLFKHGGLWFDSDVMFLRDVSPLLHYEFAYPWSKRLPDGQPENHTLNAAMLRLFKGSSANLDMITRVATEHIPFGLWGLSSLRDDSRHPDLRVVDTSLFDAFFMGKEFFTDADRAAIFTNLEEEQPETTRFDWFFYHNENLRKTGLRLLFNSRSLVYHWHNRWDFDAQTGSAFRLYEDFFDCALSGACAQKAHLLQQPPLGAVHDQSCLSFPWQPSSLCPQGRGYWTSKDMKALLPEFAQVYQKRPIRNNAGGMNVNHAFALWFTVRSVKPKHIIESGVYRGFSSWLLRQASSEANIYSLDPASESQLQYLDNASGRTSYFMGDNFTDFSKMPWGKMIPPEELLETLVIFDDHQSALRRVKEARAHGFVHLWFDDNFYQGGDTYSLNMVCSPFSDRIHNGDGEGYEGGVSASIDSAQHAENRQYFLDQVNVFFEFPAVLDGCSADVEMLLSEERQLRELGLPIVNEDFYQYWSLHPPYVKLHV